MKEIFYKIGEVSEMLKIEQHTLRYLESTLRLKIKRDERGDRLYSEKDVDTLRLVLQLKEKGLNTTAIKMALENSEAAGSSAESTLPSTRAPSQLELAEVLNIASKIIEQNQALLEQNRKMEERMERIEKKLDKRNQERAMTRVDSEGLQIHLINLAQMLESGSVESVKHLKILESYLSNTSFQKKFEQLQHDVEIFDMDNALIKLKELASDLNISI
jgi:DNA-binding transcriptional MerR regulator